MCYIRVHVYTSLLPSCSASLAPRPFLPPFSPLPFPPFSPTFPLPLHQKLQSELEALKAASQNVSQQQQQNGPVGEETDDGGTVEEKGDEVQKEFHEEVVHGKEEELVKVREENDELREELKQTRAKLDDLKTKNDVSSITMYMWRSMYMYTYNVCSAYMYVRHCVEYRDWFVQSLCGH